jgi:uncharacterized membrane protein HdeD (DUF308 family)
MASRAAVYVDGLARNWWVVLLRGLVGILFGILTFFQPGISLAALVLVFGAYAFVDGILTLVSAIRRRSTTDRWGLLVLEGIAGILVGIATLFLPGVTALVLLYLIAAWALVTGILEIAAAIRLRKVIRNEWLLALSGIASIILGVVLIVWPGPGALAVVLFIGAYAFVFGALLVGLSLRLRSLGAPRHRPQTAHGVA